MLDSTLPFFLKDFIFFSLFFVEWYLIFPRLRRDEVWVRSVVFEQGLLPFAQLEEIRRLLRLPDHLYCNWNKSSQCHHTHQVYSMTRAAQIAVLHMIALALLQIRTKEVETIGTQKHVSKVSISVSLSHLASCRSFPINQLGFGVVALVAHRVPYVI